ncbi:OPT oligopeptide transporter protein-domain-containing protein [Chytriomyces sp. MP71]|nr:OPT oligopeptide transporter protein-domain-containing protein [Chytriomyces sp. MP71]
MCTANESREDLLHMQNAKATETDLDVDQEMELEHLDAASVEDADEEGEEDYTNEIYDIIDSIVPRSDNPSLPALTFRVWVLGILFGSLLCVANTIFTFRTNPFVISPVVAALLAYPIAQFMAKTLPKSKWLNPGKFNHKEHALIFIFSSTMGAIPYALKNVVINKYWLQHFKGNVADNATCFIFVIATQTFGYCFAGLCRRFLVRPAVMLWPQNLGIVAMLNSLHQADDINNGPLHLSRSTYFFLASSAMAFYQILPGYVAPMLSAISFVCWMADRNAPFDPARPAMARVLGSAQNGVGFLSITLDWSLITQYNVILSPLWAVLNQFIGLYLSLWIAIPMLWYFNSFGPIDRWLGADPSQGPNGSGSLFPLGFAVNSVDIFNKSGMAMDLLTVKWFAVANASDAADHNEIVGTLTFDRAWYNANQPLYISTYFAFEYVASFAVLLSAMMHVWLWYGPEISFRLNTKHRDLDNDDIHNILMDVYPEVPDLWYLVLLVFTSLCLIVVCAVNTGFDLPWYGVLAAVVLALYAIIPIGVIESISGQQIGLKAIGELLGGFLFPKNLLGVMTFKTISSMAMVQGLTLVADMKMGHYLKVPPRMMFVVQLASSVLGSIVSTAVAIWLCDTLTMQNEQPLGAILDRFSNSGWSGVQYRVFLSEGLIWGAIGSSDFLGAYSSPYFKMLLGFAIGFFLPIVPYLLHKAYPNSFWHLVNIPLIFVFPAQVGGLRSDLVTPLLVAILFNYFIRVYRTAWWRKFAYMTSAAFDAGSGLTLLIIFLFAHSNFRNYSMPFPSWALNPMDTEGCASDYYLRCASHRAMGNSFGYTYDQNLDPACVHFQMDD